MDAFILRFHDARMERLTKRLVGLKSIEEFSQLFGWQGPMEVNLYGHRLCMVDDFFNFVGTQPTGPITNHSNLNVQDQEASWVCYLAGPQKKLQRCSRSGKIWTNLPSTVLTLERVWFSGGACILHENVFASPNQWPPTVSVMEWFLIQALQKRFLCDEVSRLKSRAMGNRHGVCNHAVVKFSYWIRPAASAFIPWNQHLSNPCLAVSRQGDVPRWAGNRLDLCTNGARNPALGGSCM